MPNRRTFLERAATGVSVAASARGLAYAASRPQDGLVFDATGEIREVHDAALLQEMRVIGHNAVWKRSGTA